MPMDPSSIIVLTFGTLLALSLLVIGGMVLSARVFTTLTELIAKLGSLVIQHSQVPPLPPTALSTQTGAGSTSSQTVNTPTVSE